MNNILSISEEAKITQQIEIENLGRKIEFLGLETRKSLTQEQELYQRIAILENEKKQLLENSSQEILEAQMKASSTLKQVEFYQMKLRF